MPRSVVTILLLSGLLGLSACAESFHQVQRETGLLGIPPELEKQIDSSVSFADLLAAPANYSGRIVAIGGIVIGAKRTKEQTEIEILELPTQSDGPSIKERTKSRGRFLAVRDEFLDPATVPAGTPITIIGAVKGMTKRLLDESEYAYPVLEIKHLIDWNTVASRDPGDGTYVYYGPFYPPYGYWGAPYSYYPYGGRSYPYFIQPRPSAPPPPLPPPANIPPRFRRR